MSKMPYIIVALYGLGIIGWILNLIALIQCDFASPYKEEVIRIIGAVIAPLGAVLGFINL